jgi:hypothetical protein
MNRTASSKQPARYAAPALAFLGGFVAVGVPYWRLPYSQVSLPDSLYGGGLAVVFVAALALRWRYGSGLRAAALAAGTAPAAAVLARVTVETAMDPTSHNLWPLEVVIAATVGMLVAAAGALLGSLARRWSSRSSGPGPGR